MLGRNRQNNIQYFHIELNRFPRSGMLEGFLEYNGYCEDPRGFSQSVVTGLK